MVKINNKLKIIAEALDSKKARDVKIIKIDDITSIADYFVIATGTSSTQVKALGDEVDFQMGKAEINPLRIEGTGKNGWILIDYGDIVVHVFHKEAREFYDLDRIWADGQEISMEEIIGE